MPEYQTQRQKDITPKLAAAWDVFGDGKTALKVNLGKYVLGQALSAPQLSVTSNSNVVLTATRSWVDNNSNFIPDCDLTNPAGQGPTLAGGLQQVDTCGVVTGAGALITATSRFRSGRRMTMRGMAGASGRTAGSSRWPVNGSSPGAFRCPAATSGAGSATSWSPTTCRTPRPTTIGTASRVADSARAGVGRRRHAARRHLYHRLLQPEGRYRGRVQQLHRPERTFFPGSRQIDHWNGFDVSVNARLAHGLIFQGGISSGKQTTDNCDIVNPANAGKFGDRSPLVEWLRAGRRQLPFVIEQLPYRAGHADAVEGPGLVHRAKIDVQIGATYQSIPGIEWGANYTEINSDIARPTHRAGSAACRSASLRPPRRRRCRSSRRRRSTAIG